MRQLLCLALIPLLGACQTEDPEDFITFKNGKKFKKEKIAEGVRDGCMLTQDAEMMPYVDREGYCDCVTAGFMANAANIEINTESDDPEDVQLSATNYFNSDEGSAMQLACLDDAIDEEAFDWTENTEYFMEECMSAAVADSARLAAHCSCVRSKIIDGVSVIDFLSPEFAESAQVQGFIEACAAEHGLQVTL